MIDNMRYDIKTFINKKIRILRHTYICITKSFPLKLLICCDVDPSKIPGSTKFPHPVGIVISKNVSLGEGCRIRQNVTIGGRKKSGYPIIGNGIKFGAGSIIIGHLTIGDNANIGAGAIVLKNVPANTTVVGVWK